MKILVAVTTCEARRHQADAQRATWVPDSNHDVRFFLAAQERDPLADEVFLPCSDGYEDLPAKVKAMCGWAVKEGFDLCLKIDDDICMWPTRIVIPQGHYTGWKQEPDGYNYCSGLAYWLSRDAMKIVAEAPLTEMQYEDRWVGQTLKEAGIRAEQQPGRGIQWVGNVSKRPLPPNYRAILSNAYVAGEFTAEELPLVYRY